jgi:hypothetical protein
VEQTSRSALVKTRDGVGGCRDQLQARAAETLEPDVLTEGAIWGQQKKWLGGSRLPQRAIDGIWVWP